MGIFYVMRWPKICILNRLIKEKPTTESIRPYTLRSTPCHKMKLNKREAQRERIQYMELNATEYRVVFIVEHP